MIRSEGELHDLPGQFTIKIIPVAKFTMVKDPYIACLDADIIEYPLILRNWTEGDSFYPLGMTGKKKLSNFFIDQKIPANKKDKVVIMESAGRIAWIVGYRTDNRFRVNPDTRRVLIISAKPG